MRLDAVAANNLDHQCDGCRGLSEMAAKRAVVVFVIFGRGRLRRIVIVMRTSGSVVTTSSTGDTAVRVRMA